MKKKRKSTNYSRGKTWGRKTIKSEFKFYGKRAIATCDKSAATCSKYGRDRRIKKTKKGKKLNELNRSYYRGIADGMQLGYNDIMGFKPIKKSTKKSWKKIIVVWT